MTTNEASAPWWRWLIGKVSGAIIVLWVAVTVTFIAVRLIPGDPAEAILGGPGSQTSAEALAMVRRDYALDQPLIVQYFRYIGGLLRGDLGRSYALKIDVSTLLGAQLWSSLALAGLALILAWAIALLAVSLAAMAPRLGGPVIGAVEILFTVMPHFWLGSVLIMVFSSILGWFPAVSDPGNPVGLVLPVITLALPLAGYLGQVMRERLTDATQSVYAEAAVARGASPLAVLVRHTLRHSIVPAIGLSGWAFGFLMSGAVVVETVFARPGLGRLLMDAVLRRDIPLVTGVVLVVALGFIVVNLATDAVMRVVDPEIKGDDQRNNDTRTVIV